MRPGVDPRQRRAGKSRGSRCAAGRASIGAARRRRPRRLRPRAARIPPIRCCGCPTSSRRRTSAPRPSRLRSACRSRQSKRSLEALSGASYVPAVNLPFRGPADPTGAAVWMRLAERAARFLRPSGRTGSLRSPSRPGASPTTCCGRWPWPPSRGALRGHAPETVNYVNAFHVAQDRGVAVSRDPP